MRLHLCCGTRHLPCAKTSLYNGDWVNVDIRPEVKPDLVADVLDANALCAALELRSVSVIYLCHGPEHFTREQAAHGFRLWRQLLRAGGVLRIAAPDARTLTKLYLDHPDVDLSAIHGSLMGRHDYEHNVHHSTWDFPTLATSLREAGFYDIERYDPVKVAALDYPILWDDYSLARICGQYISLCVEAKAH